MHFPGVCTAWFAFFAQRDNRYLLPIRPLRRHLPDSGCSKARQITYPDRLTKVRETSRRCIKSSTVSSVLRYMSSSMHKGVSSQFILGVRRRPGQRMGHGADMWKQNLQENTLANHLRPHAERRGWEQGSVCVFS